MIDLIPAPNQIIIIGPKATLGKLFNIVRYGSITFCTVLNHQSIVAIIVPSIVAILKLKIVS